MMPFFHFLTGSLAMYLLPKEKRSLKTFLLAGFFGILADFDWPLMYIPYIKDMPFLLHRHITHTIFAAILIGIITYGIYTNFHYGFWAYFSHTILDYFGPGGGVWILPYISIVFPWPVTQELELIISSILGTIILIGLLLYEYNKKEEK